RSSILITCGDEVSDLALASRCFGLYFDEHFVTGVYKRVIRFVSNRTNIFVVPEKVAGSAFLELSNSSITL
ncbi:hypothetical protein NECAME_08100, partial [Necator americanus]